MSDWVRVANFEADNDAIERIVNEISSSEGPPQGIPAKSILVLADRENGRARIVVRFDTDVLTCACTALHERRQLHGRRQGTGPDGARPELSGSRVS